MFVIEKIFIEDKKLAQVLTALAGLVLDMPAPKPVVNAEVKKGKVRQASVEGTSMIGRVASQVQRMQSGESFTSDDLKAIITSASGNVNSIGTVRNWLVERKLIKNKERGVYTVL